jgi:hypothetical protein
MDPTPELVHHEEGEVDEKKLVRKLDLSVGLSGSAHADAQAHHALALYLLSPQLYRSDQLGKCSDSKQ